jgi:hypothetical protein
MLKSFIDMHNYNYSIFKKYKSAYVYIYSDKYITVLVINNITRLHIISGGTISLESYGLNNIGAFLRQFSLCDFTKIKFVGKGYKIKKNRHNNIFLLFNKSHITNV